MIRAAPAVATAVTKHNPLVTCTMVDVCTRKTQMLNCALGNHQQVRCMLMSKSLYSMSSFRKVQERISRFRKDPNASNKLMGLGAAGYSMVWFSAIVGSLPFTIGIVSLIASSQAARAMLLQKLGCEVRPVTMIPFIGLMRGCSENTDHTKTEEYVLQNKPVEMCLVVLAPLAGMFAFTVAIPHGVGGVMMSSQCGFAVAKTGYMFGMFSQLPLGDMTPGGQLLSHFSRRELLYGTIFNFALTLIMHSPILYLCLFLNLYRLNQRGFTLFGRQFGGGEGEPNYATGYSLTADTFTDRHKVIIASLYWMLFIMNVCGMMLVSNSLLAQQTLARERGRALQGDAYTPAAQAEKAATAVEAELTNYFSGPYLHGLPFVGTQYEHSCALDEMRTLKYVDFDGHAIHVWEHAFDLRSAGNKSEGPSSKANIVLYHYTDELGFRNIIQEELDMTELFASLQDDRAHFGLGIYATQLEPSRWGSAMQILLNNYSRGNPWDPDTQEARRVWEEWSDRVAYCIPLIVPRELAYDIHVRQPPDLAKKIEQLAASGKLENPEAGFLGREHKGRLVSPGRDIWVVRIVGPDGRIQNATRNTEWKVGIYCKRVKALRKLFGHTHPKTIASTHALAMLLWKKGRLDEAEPLLRWELHALRETRGEADEETLYCMNGLALVLKSKGQLDDAETLHREALRGRRHKLGDDPGAIIVHLSNLAGILHSKGRISEEGFDEAEPLLWEALQLAHQYLGDTHPKTLQLINGQAVLLCEKGQIHAAEIVFLEALQVLRQKLGNTHPQTLALMHNLGVLRRHQGCEFYHEAVRQLRSNGNKHPQIFTVDRVALDVARSNGDELCVSAEPVLRYVLEGRRRKLGDTHPETLTSIHSLAVLLYDKGQLDDAEKLFWEAYVKKVQKLGYAHPETDYTITFLRRLWQEREQCDGK